MHTGGASYRWCADAGLHWKAGLVVLEEHQLPGSDSGTTVMSVLTVGKVGAGYMETMISAAFL